MGEAALAVYAADEAGEERVDDLAAHLQAPLLSRAEAEAGARLCLAVSAEGLALEGRGMRLQPDFSRELARLAPGRVQRELLVRAAKVKGAESPTVLDATAGLGEDALLLAAAGFRVDMYERDPVIAALLQDALERAAADPRLAPVVARMRVHEADGAEALRRITGEGAAPDAVYLDPMFPERRKSAAVKKKFQLLHLLESPCADEAGLLQAALDARPRKVVVKRPLKGPFLAGRKPSYSLSGKSIRYDVYAR